MENLELETLKIKYESIQVELSDIRAKSVKELEDIRAENVRLDAELFRFGAKVEKLVGALRFYADEAVKPRDHWNTEFLWDDDLGARAREALKEWQA